MATTNADASTSGKIVLTPDAIEQHTLTAAVKYMRDHGGIPPKHIYGVPRGGVAWAYKLAHTFSNIAPAYPQPVVSAVSDSMEGSGLVVDDIVTTGNTLSPFSDMDTMAMITQHEEGLPKYFGERRPAGEWFIFPWDEKSMMPDEAVVRLLEFLGRDPNDPSIRETPRRFLGWLTEFSENQAEPEITSFTNQVYDQMVIVSNIPFISLCEHHLLPFEGEVAIGYIPGKGNEIIGLSKLARIVTHKAKRTQVQERLTEEIRLAVAAATNCPSVAVIVKAEHSCMSWRGPKAKGSVTTTSAMSGDFRKDPKAREEFLKLSSSR